MKHVKTQRLGRCCGPYPCQPRLLLTANGGGSIEDSKSDAANAQLLFNREFRSTSRYGANQGKKIGLGLYSCDRSGYSQGVVGLALTV